MKKNWILLVAAVLMLNGISACEKKGPAEKAGEKVDNAVEKAGDKVEDATDGH